MFKQLFDKQLGITELNESSEQIQDKFLDGSPNREYQKE